MQNCLGQLKYTLRDLNWYRLVNYILWGWPTARGAQSPSGSEPASLSTNKPSDASLVMYADSIHHHTIQSPPRWAGHGESLQRTAFCGSRCARERVIIRMPACLTPPAGRAHCETAGIQPKLCAPTGRLVRAVPQWWIWCTQIQHFHWSSSGETGVNTSVESAVQHGVYVSHFQFYYFFKCVLQYTPFQNVILIWWQQTSPGFNSAAKLAFSLPVVT